MSGQVVSIYRHPVKGFTPERLDAADLRVGEGLAFDRVYAVENGPSGFDPAAPAHVPKQKFTVLANIPKLARTRTAFNGATSTLTASAPEAADFRGCLDEEEGREAFAAWLSTLIADHLRGPLRVIPAPGAHRFTDHPLGHLSIVNLASVRDLEARVGAPVDPLRFRANIHVDGWPAWAELGWMERTLSLGTARLEIIRPIVRCAAILVDPVTGERDMQLTKALFDNYGHMYCGVYAHVSRPGLARPGLACTLLEVEAPACP